MLAALENLEDELIALFAVLPQERVDVLGSGCLERLEAVALVDTLDDADDVFTPTHVFRKEVAHAACWLCAGCHTSSAVPEVPRVPQVDVHRVRTVHGAIVARTRNPRHLLNDNPRNLMNLRNQLNLAHYNLGSVSPSCFWYLPFLSA